VSGNERGGMRGVQWIELEVLLRAVTRARAALELARTQGSSRAMARPEQRELLAALAAYAVALTRLGHPVPYRMRSELAMYRVMFDPTRRRS
jgi:hypothetical protein